MRYAWEKEIWTVLEGFLHLHDSLALLDDSHAKPQKWQLEESSYSCTSCRDHAQSVLLSSNTSTDNSEGRAMPPLIRYTFTRTPL